MAMQTASMIRPGLLVRTRFSGYDLGDLIDIAGISFIAKLEPTASNPKLYWGFQWFIRGRAIGLINYGPDYNDGYIEQTRCWLLDLAVIKNWFAENPTQDIVICFRSKSLDAAPRFSRESTRLKFPATDAINDQAGFRLVTGCREQSFTIGQDIPLGAWVVIDPSVNNNDAMSAAHSAAIACVWYVRFQETHPSQIASDVSNLQNA